MIATKRILISMMMAIVATMSLTAQDTYSGSIVADEGAWCWFADPRALHYENASGTINATYIGYIDVHGNVKATQYDWISHRKTDVLVRSYFQPDDHNNPTFIMLPDERVMIFYTRHTDEACIWYRISQKPGDITALGEEKRLATANNTTYPSPFILSDDPNHIYLCWRGINWHPTIARLTMPDANDDCQFDFGPKQIVQSTGARPYAKYQSNGKDKIYVSYTTGHPDNEMPDWLYFNVIDINKGEGPILRDLNGKQLSIIENGVFNVSKTDSYASNYAATIVDKTAGIRNWVWQIALDNDEHPVIAYPHIDDAKTTHAYWYARWNGTKWKTTKVTSAGHAFHQNWNQTERCYSGGMSLDPDNINDMYLSIPTKDGLFNKDGVYEIWRYTIDDDGQVASSEQITKNSPKNNARPFVIPGSKNSPMRVGWMQGDYYYWMVNKNYPKGYPTAIHCDYEWKEELTKYQGGVYPTCHCFWPNGTLTLGYEMNANIYEGVLFTVGDDILHPDLVYRINAEDQRPEIVFKGKTYKSQNRLLTSDDWANASTGTNGDNHPTKLTTWIFSMTYDGKTLTTYRNGFVDQVIEIEGWNGGNVNAWVQFTDEETMIQNIHRCLYISTDYVCHSPYTLQQQMVDVKKEMQENRNMSLPKELKNGNFEGTYAPMENSGVASDRAIYVPEGWTVEYSSRNENDLTALKAGDLYYDRFFASLAKPANGGTQTYWLRQNWGTSTIALCQELLLPKGKYTLSTDVWKSGLGGDAYLQAVTQDGATTQAPTVENKEAWQQMTLTFESDGSASTTIRLVAMHNNNGTEKIIGFDNVVLTLSENGDVEPALKRSSMQVINDMAPGWNLGNTLEGVATWAGVDFLNNKGGLGAETAWQGTKTTQAIIDFVKSLGFKSVRIPCSWAFGHISNASTYEIDSKWMARVKEVVDYCINDSLYVILNDHWDGGWLENHIKDTDTATIEKNKEVLTALWTQIANVFKDYDEYLLFAGLNEPNAEDQAATNNLIQYNQAFVDAVRATGGNNASRVLVVQGPSTSIEHTCDFMAGKMPTDIIADRLAVEVHYYNPWQFWGMENDESWGKVFYYWGKGNHLSGSTHNATWGEEADMKKQLLMMKNKFVDLGYPVVIGEFGANWRDLSSLTGESQDKHNASIKAHYRELHRLCKDMGGMVPMTWDTNYCSQDGTKGSMTIIDRENLTVFGTYAMEGINEIYPRPTELGVRTIERIPDEHPEYVYRLNGQRVDARHLTKGLYISKGKKIVVSR